ncbi:MAG: hypothetical protein J6O55_07855, partial [Lachnospiraceae bacterium]|nr:hypothetical protein [Lachnospiraceae bacterium]
MGSSFFMNTGFINLSLKKWLPRMNDYQRDMLSNSIYGCLEDLSKGGKNENMLKNAYIKFMCWLYYKFEGLVGRLGNNTVPKILYESDPKLPLGSYELLMLSILVNSGCDAVLLQRQGDSSYLKLDPPSHHSYPFEDAGLTAFPDNYGIAKLRKDLQSDYENARLYGPMPQHDNCTNAWIGGRSVFEDVKMPIQSRGKDFSGLQKNFSENRDKFFFNCFCRINGVEDRLTYENELLTLYREIADTGRRIEVVDGEIPIPSTEEIAAVKRRNVYYNPELLLSDMAANLKGMANTELMRIAHKAFIDVMLPESKKSGISLNKLMNSCVYLISYIRRYIPKLFSGWKYPEVECFIHFGPCVNEN